MLRAEIWWLASGPTLKLKGRLIDDWAKQATSLVTRDVVPKGLIVDLTEVSHLDTAGEQLLKWLGSVGAKFVADSIYALGVCERLRLRLLEKIPARPKATVWSNRREGLLYAFTCGLKRVQRRKGGKMSWFHASMKAVDARNHASVAEIVACFHDERSLLGRLALLITGDQATADQSVNNACEVTLHGNSPFRDWLLEWAKAATIASAISRRAGAIRACADAYKGQRCTHVEHPWQGDAEERVAHLNLILQADPLKLIVELDPLCRAILVLKVAIRSSIQDCVLRLNVSRAAVLAANCHAMTWLHDFHVKLLEENSIASHAIQKCWQGSET